MNDFTKDLKSHLYDRIKSPFAFAFSISLGYQLWPILFIIFDKNKIAEFKIVYIRIIIEEVCIWDLFIHSGLLILTFAGSSVIGVLIREIQLKLSKWIRNKLNIDYINTQQYLKIVDGYSEERKSYRSTIEQNDLNVIFLKSVYLLTTEQKNVLQEVISRGNNYRVTDNDPNAQILKILHNKNVLISSTNKYSLDPNYLHLLK